MRLYKHQVITEPVPEEQWEKLNLKDKIFLNATKEFMTFVEGKIRLYSQYSFMDDRGFFYYCDSATDRMTGETIVASAEHCKMDLMEIELSMHSRIGLRHNLRNTDADNYYNNFRDKYEKMIKSRHQFEKLKRDLVGKSYEVREHEAIIKLWKNRENILKRHNMGDGKKIFKFENVTAEDTCAEGDDIFLGDLEFQVDFLTMKVELISGTHERYTGYGDVVHPHHLGGTQICLGSQTSDMNDAIMSMDADYVQILLSKFAESYTSDDDAGQWWTQWTEDKARVYVEYEGEWYNRDEVVYDRYGNALNEEYAVYIEEHEAYARMSECNDSRTYGRYIYHEDAVYSSVMSDYILKEDENIVELEYGDGFALSTHENVIEYKDKFYRKGMTVDVDGERIPSEFTVYSNPLDRYLLTDTAVQHEGEWYTEDTIPSPEPVAENEEKAPETIEQVIEEATALGVLDEESKASIETVVTPANTEDVAPVSDFNVIPTYTEELTETVNNIDNPEEEVF